MERFNQTAESSLLYMADDGGQGFVHDTYKDFFLARPFIGPINSGNVPVSELYLCFWGDGDWLEKQSSAISKKPVSPSLTFLKNTFYWLETDKAEEFTTMVSAPYFEKSRKTEEKAFKDLCFCGELVGSHPVLPDVNSGIVKKVIDSLFDAAQKYDDASEMIHINNMSKAAKKALASSKSYAALEKLLGYANWCDNVPSRYALIDDERLYSQRDAYLAVRNLALNHLDRLDELFSNNLKGCPHAVGVYVGVMNLMGDYGGRGSFDSMTQLLYNRSFVANSYSYKDITSISPFFSNIFKIMERQEFDPFMVREFNNAISQVQDEAFFNYYLQFLKHFSRKLFTKSGIHLYDLLEKNKMQFWDFWRTYQHDDPESNS